MLKFEGLLACPAAGATELTCFKPANDFMFAEVSAALFDGGGGPPLLPPLLPPEIAAILSYGGAQPAPPPIRAPVWGGSWAGCETYQQNREPVQDHSRSKKSCSMLFRFWSQFLVSYSSIEQNETKIQLEIRNRKERMFPPPQL